MQGPIAQIAALTTYGNAALSAKRDLKQLEFYPGNTTFQFCEHVQFVDLQSTGERWDEERYADDPLQWVARLKKEGTSRLQLIHLTNDGERLGDGRAPDRMTVGFVGGGGRWLIEAVSSGSSAYWEARWEVGDQGRPDHRIWQVTYVRCPRDQPHYRHERIELEELKAAMRQTLLKIADFAFAHDLQGFANAFNSGLSKLDSQRPLSGTYHPDIAPARFLPLAALQLLGASQSAWVFGGMGSWNDLGFEGEDQILYDKISEQLFQLLNKAICVAANSSAGMATRSQRRPWWRLWD